MSVHWVNYDLKKTGQNYDELIKYLKSHTSWARPLASSFFVSTSLSASQLRDGITKVVDANDAIVVVTVDGSDWATKGISAEVTGWMRKKHLIAASTATEWWTWSGSNAEWISALGSVGAVAVAIIFGVATLSNSRRSKDNQERSTLVAAEEQRTPLVAPLDVPEEPTTKPDPSDPGTASEEAAIASQLLGQLINRAIYAGAQQQQHRAHLSITAAGGEVWRLTNFGEEAAFNLEIEGLTGSTNAV